ncbi:MAG: hypothetical protein R3B99_27125 [Polyangiales bacterium]
MLRTLSLVTLLFLVACAGGPEGPRIRYAQASPAQLSAVRGERTVWYEFHPGDEVPMTFVLAGIFESATPQPIRMVAKQHFWIVVQQGGQTYFSFDGRQLMRGDQLAKWGVLLGTEGDDAGQTGVLLLVGRPQDLPPAMR